MKHDPGVCLRPQLQHLLHPLQYKSSPCKKVCVTGWMVLLPDDPSRLNIFQLSNPDKGLTPLPPPVFLSSFHTSHPSLLLQAMFTSSRQRPGFQPSSGTRSWRRPVEAGDPRQVHLPAPAAGAAAAAAPAALLLLQLCCCCCS